MLIFFFRAAFNLGTSYSLPPTTEEVVGVGDQLWHPSPLQLTLPPAAVSVDLLTIPLTATITAMPQPTLIWQLLRGGAQRQR